MATKADESTPISTPDPSSQTVLASNRRLSQQILWRIAAGRLGGRPLPAISLRQTFSAFKYRNYRLWFAGQLVSLVGTWMQTTAQGYLLFQLTLSPVYLGYLGFASGMPSWLFMLYGGVIADRISRRTLLIVTQALMMVLAFILAGLTFMGLIQPWHILLLALAFGVVNAFDAPSRQAFVVEMVEHREDLTNAIALNSSMFNLAVAVGPAVAGLTYALVGPAWCFTINGFSFITVIAALSLMRVRPPIVRPRTRAALDDLKEGLRYVISNVPIRTLIATAAVMSLFGMTFMTLMPAWATMVLGGDATTNGWLLSARGVGALGGALMIASLGNFKFKGKLLTMGTFAFPALLLVFAATRWLPLSLVAMMGVGWGVIVLFNLANSLVQILVPDELRGRVISIYTLNFFGLMPIGALLAGAVAEAAGEPAAVTMSALIALAFALFLWWRAPGLRALE